MTREEAISLARDVARQQQWSWREPVKAVKRRRWLIGPAVWHVVSNAEATGVNVNVTIDDATGEVREKNYHPR